MSFRPSAPKPKPAPVVDDRKKATVRFTKPQWKQLRHYLADKDTTLQALVIACLADRLENFDA
jgi:hypothetical protein